MAGRQAIRIAVASLTQGEGVKGLGQVRQHRLEGAAGVGDTVQHHHGDARRVALLDVLEPHTGGKGDGLDGRSDLALRHASNGRGAIRDGFHLSSRRVSGGGNLGAADWRMADVFAAAPSKDYARWLDPGDHDIADLLAPYPAKGRSRIRSAGGSTVRRTTTRS